MGQRIREICERYATPEENRDYIDALRGFSDAVQEASQAALNETLQTLIQCVDDKGNIVHGNDLEHEVTRIELNGS